MRLVEVAAETGSAPFEISARAPAGELLEEVLDQVLLRELLDDLDLLDRDRDLARDAAPELHAAAGLRDEQPDQLSVRDEWDGEARAPAAAGELRAELRQAERLPRGPLLGVAGDALELLAARVEEIHVAGARAEQRAGALDHRLDELLEPVGARDLLCELGELLELGHAQARLLVQPRVLDRARDERRRGHEEVDLVVRELARRLGVRGDDADHVAGAPDHRHREQRLELLLLELREVLRARVGEGVVADERRLGALGRPPREPLSAVDDDLAGLALVRRRGGAEHQPLAVLGEEVDEAGMDAARVGHQANDGAQHLGELQRRRDRRHDLLKRLLARMQRHQAWIVRPRRSVDKSARSRRTSRVRRWRRRP